jgi:hypothetical protein
MEPLPGLLNIGEDRIMQLSESSNISHKIKIYK